MATATVGPHWAIYIVHTWCTVASFGSNRRMNEEGTTAQPLYFSTSGADGIGGRTLVNFKCWRHGDVCRWEVKPILVSLGLLGSDECVGDWFRKRRDAVLGIWHFLGVDPAEHWRGSRKALEAQAKRAGVVFVPGCTEHDEFHCSSVCLLAILIWTKAAAGSAVRRCRGEWFMQEVVQLLVPADCETAMTIEKVPAEILVACPLARGGRPCCHLEAALQVLQCASHGCLSARLCPHMFGLWASSGDCPSRKRQLVRALGLVASSMDQRAPDRAYATDPRKAHKDIGDLGRRNKRQRVDEDYKKAVVADTIEQGLAKTPRALLVTDGEACPDNVGKWDEEHTLNTMSANWLSFSRVQHMSVAGDGSRLGNPAEETVVMVACSPASRIATWLPPQAIAE